jgi:hypothetical protein
MGESGDGPADHEDDVWPVEPSPTAAEILADPALTAKQFSKIVALTVAITEDPWLAGSREAEPGSLWRTLPIPDGGGVIEYVIIEEDHRVILTRIVPF